MATTDILSLLIAERDRLNRAIAALQGKDTGGRGGEGASPARKKRQSRRRSKASRKAQSERMKAYWAAKRKQKQQGK